MQSTFWNDSLYKNAYKLCFWFFLRCCILSYFEKYEKKNQNLPPFVIDKPM